MKNLRLLFPFCLCPLFWLAQIKESGKYNQSILNCEISCNIFTKLYLEAYAQKIYLIKILIYYLSKTVFSNICCVRPKITPINGNITIETPT